MKRKAVVAGATGLVGKQVMYKLLENNNYDTVYVLVRRTMEIKHPKLQQILFDYSNFETLDSSVPPIDDVFCCLGTTMKKAGSKEAFYQVDFTFVHELAKYFSSKSAENFLLISAIGADTQSSVYYSRVKGEIENAVSKLNFKGYFIFRPSFLMGDRQEFRLGEKIGIVLAVIISPFLVGSLKKYKPIHAAVVANNMIDNALSGKKGKVVIEGE